MRLLSREFWRSTNQLLGPWLEGRRQLFLLFGVIALFFLLGLAQTWSNLGEPFKFHPGDDWTFYHRNATNILEEGLWMHYVSGPYTLGHHPAGFLYNYFIALCYWVFGAHPSYVYLVQSAMLGSTVVLLFLAFRRKLRPRTQLVLLAALTVFAFLDVQRYYVIRLLSENLFIFESALFFYLLFLGYLDRRRWAQIAALGLLGVMLLTRPNILIFVPPLLAWLIITRHGRGRGKYLDFVAGLLLLMVVGSFIGLRNHAVTGKWIFFPPAKWAAFYIPGYGPAPTAAKRLLGPNAVREGLYPLMKMMGIAFTKDPGVMSVAYVKRILFSVGFLPILRPEYRYRPHWLLMWVAYIAVIAFRLAGDRPINFREKTLHLYVVTLLSLEVGVSTNLGNYGFRSLFPIVLPAVAGAVPLIDIVRLPWRREAG